MYAKLGRITNCATRTFVRLVRKGVVNLGKWAGGTVAPWDHKMATGLGKEGSFLRLGRGEGAKDCTQVLSRGIPSVSWK